MPDNVNIQYHMKINCRETAGKICRFLRKEFKKRKKTAAVVGVSGGVDSSLTAKLCEMAGLDVKKVFLPCGKIFQAPKDYSFKIDITRPVEECLKEIGTCVLLDKIDKGNIMARMRMIVQYALARKLNGLVVGTENLSEYYLGYFTLHGDQACDINPIGELWKTQVTEMAKYLGLDAPEPTAGLWQGQTDQKELGFSYEQADLVLYLYCVKKIAAPKIIKNFGLDADLARKVIKRVNDTEFKRQK